MAVLVQVAAVLLRSATIGAASAGPASDPAAWVLGGPPLWTVFAAAAAQTAAAAVIAATARASWWPTVFSVLLLVGGLAQGLMAADMEPAYLVGLGAVLVAPGLWVALWAWGWRWPETAEDRAETPQPARAD